nr:hypothetical protein [Tanacetum cinerariifolium]
MENLSHYGLDNLAEVHNHDNVNHNVINQVVQVMPCSEQSNIVNYLETEITSDRNIIPYSQYAVDQHRLESKLFEVKMNHVLNKNERILKQVLNKDIVKIVVNSSMENASVNMHECKECLKLETELLNKKDFIEKETYDKVFKHYTTLEKHWISLEFDTQLNQEIFQKDNSVSNQRVKPSTSASVSQALGNTKKDRIQRPPSRTVIVQHFKLNANYELICVKCNGCMLSDNHDFCVLIVINGMNARPKSISVKKTSKRKVWKPTGKVFTKTGYTWRPASRTFTIVGNACPLTRITTTTKVPPRKPTILENDTPKPAIALVYSRKPNKYKTNVPVSKPKIIKSISANKEPSKSWGSIVSDVPSFSLNEYRLSKLLFVKFKNDHVAKIMRYGDYQTGNVTISKVYYVERLKHNLFSVRQLCDLNLEVAFRQHTCFIRNLKGDDLLTGSRARHGLVQGLPKLKFKKDHMCSTCAMGKSKKKPHKPKSEDTNQEKLYLLHMDLCGPMRVASINGKKRIVETIHVDFNELTAMASEDSSLEPTLQDMTPTTISSGIMPNPPPSIPFVPPLRIDWDLLFQSLFDELLTPPLSVDLPAPEVIAPIAEVVAPEPAASTSSHSSTTVD